VRKKGVFLRELVVEVTRQRNLERSPGSIIRSCHRRSLMSSTDNLDPLPQIIPRDECYLDCNFGTTTGNHHSVVSSSTQPPNQRKSFVSKTVFIQNNSHLLPLPNLPGHSPAPNINELTSSVTTKFTPRMPLPEPPTNKVQKRVPSISVG